ncbi:MAG: type II secretion system F family protein [Hydrogenophaga sp.]|jgi:general secretion pathway protein F|nr:type II secretion system F family protein [Hydrogenophaga sp.]
MSSSFQVRWVRAGEGAITQERMQAPSEQALIADLEAAGATVLSVRPLGSQLHLRWAAGMKKGQSFALFCRELRTLVRAGMTVVEAVDTLSARERLQGDEASLARELLTHLEQGKSLSNALSDLPSAPPVLVAAVRAGERTSDLPQALEDYLRFDQLVQQLRRKIVSASIYPAIVTALGVGISVFLLLVVMPNFARMYDQLRGEAEGMTGAMIRFSQWVSAHQGVALTATGAIAVVLALWVASGAAKRHALALLDRMPWFRARMKDFQLAMMYQALALMLKGGYPMTEALKVASRSAMDPRTMSGLTAALGSIEQGAPVARSLSNEGLCDEVGRRLMAAAERNGDFYLAADVVSQLHSERFELFVERVTRVVEPVLLMAVALLVGTIVVMMYLPVFDMATRLR